jgi:hypothetical protein
MYLKQHVKHLIIRKIRPGGAEPKYGKSAKVLGCYIIEKSHL